MSRLEHFYGAVQRHGTEGALNQMFPDEAPTTQVPWPQAGRRKDLGDYDQSLVHQELLRPARLGEVDPRALSATQPGLTRGGVRYYLGEQFAKTGQTYRDQSNPGNLDPVVYHREGGTSMLLSGHHRAAAALLRGEPLRAREVRGPWGPPR